MCGPRKLAELTWCAVLPGERMPFSENAAAVDQIPKGTIPSVLSQFASVIGWHVRCIIHTIG